MTTEYQVFIKSLVKLPSPGKPLYDPHGDGEHEDPAMMVSSSRAIFVFISRILLRAFAMRRVVAVSGCRSAEHRAVAATSRSTNFGSRPRPRSPAGPFVGRHIFAQPFQVVLRSFMEDLARRFRISLHTRGLQTVFVLCRDPLICTFLLSPPTVGSSTGKAVGGWIAIYFFFRGSRAKRDLDRKMLRDACMSESVGTS